LPAFNAYLLISLLQYFNILTFAIVLNYFLDIVISRNVAVFIGLGFATILAVVNRFLLYNKREKIFNEFENFKQARKTKGIIYFWLYVGLSIVIIFIVGVNLAPTR
jgi:phosphate/sulfate permease